MRNYVGFISENYSFDILRPLQKAALSRGDQFFWFVDGTDVNLKLFKQEEQLITDIYQLNSLQPDAVFVPGNIVPSFIPGLKVQVFHGFEWKKKGHWRIRDCFDLYCTQGPLFTKKFNELKQKHKHFMVVETGWPKLDYDLSQSQQTDSASHLTTVLYAPTFSPAFTSTPDLFEAIIKLSKQNDWRWLIKFHPKMASEWVEKFKAQAHEKLQIVGDTQLFDVFQQSDVILSDTSSIITEFILQGKPAVTYKNAQPEEVLINFTDPTQLEHSLSLALNGNSKKEQIADYCQQMHPYNDQKSSERILDAVEHILQNQLCAEKRKPLNLFRQLKMRKAYRYWRFF
jgi:CDP-glycerol glycerophosphotransferase (TagB/SpsB family)